MSDLLLKGHGCVSSLGAVVQLHFLDCSVVITHDGVDGEDSVVIIVDITDQGEITDDYST